MSLRRPQTFPRFISLLVLLAGVLLVVYARWTRPLVDAELDLDAGDADAALQHYVVAEHRFGSSTATRELAAAEYARAVGNQLHLLYAAGRYDEVVEKAANAPAGAAPHFWAGSALLARALAEKTPESRLVWSSRAEEELKSALQAAPDDWDTKVNYELAARWSAELRRQPGKKTDAPMQILRPQPRQPGPTKKSG
jgi:hypothetical protein